MYAPVGSGAIINIKKIKRMTPQQLVLQRIRDKHAQYAAETRARVEICIARIREAQIRHECLMRLSRDEAAVIQMRAVAIDARQGDARLHTSPATEKTFYKYV